MATYCLAGVACDLFLWFNCADQREYYCTRELPVVQLYYNKTAAAEPSNEVCGTHITKYTVFDTSQVVNCFQVDSDAALLPS